MTLPSWHDKISNHHQLGGIETAVLDNGAGRGTRIAWVNTGSGLRFKVALDRAMDIGEAFYNQHSLAWLSHSGTVFPQPLADKGVDWLRAFSGGLLTTCGLTHVGGPESDAYGHRGLHDQISNTPAEIETILQPDLLAGHMDMRSTGKMTPPQVLGTQLEWKRTLSVTLGSSTVRIHDEVRNCGNMPAPHMLLYHFNFGWPLVDEGTHIIWKGGWQPREKGMSEQIFRQGADFHKCRAPLTEHNGTGEAAAFIDAVADTDGICTCGLYNANLNLALFIRFQKAQLPCLTNWQHWGRGEYVTGLEPGTHFPIGQAKARENGELLFLQPGESRQYDIKIEVLENEAAIHEILKNN